MLPTLTIERGIYEFISLHFRLLGMQVQAVPVNGSVSSNSKGRGTPPNGCRNTRFTFNSGPFAGHISMPRGFLASLFCFCLVVEYVFKLQFLLFVFNIRTNSSRCLFCSCQYLSGCVVEVVCREAIL